MKNIVLFLSAACLLSAPIFGQQQENRFAEITNPQLLSYQQAAASCQFHLLHRRDIGFEQGQGERKFLPTFERDMEIPLYRKIQRKTHEFHGARF